MQFPGELMPGLYFDAEGMRDFLSILNQADDQLNEVDVMAGAEEVSDDIEDVLETLATLRGMLNRPGITPPQRARLEE